ncbi:MAG: hypothetical protein U9N81_00345 [Bacillota bacterium]|nr:hypothetical protein [Bacillota bacterium]
MILFGSSAAGSGLASNPVFSILGVFLATYIFLKFCSWAKGFQLSGSLKKWIFILTGVGLVVFNLLYSKGNALIHTTGDWSGATVALAASLAWVFVFAFALMAANKPE